MALRICRDLEVWQRAIDLVEAVYLLARRFPDGERFGLTSQMQRVAVSVPTNIAEGYGRSHRGDYLHHLSVAPGIADGGGDAPHDRRTPGVGNQRAGFTRLGTGPAGGTDVEQTDSFTEAAEGVSSRTPDPGLRTPTQNPAYGPDGFPSHANSTSVARFSANVLERTSRFCRQIPNMAPLVARYWVTLLNLPREAYELVWPPLPSKAIFLQWRT